MWPQTDWTVQETGVSSFNGLRKRKHSTLHRHCKNGSRKYRSNQEDRKRELTVSRTNIGLGRLRKEVARAGQDVTVNVVAADGGAGYGTGGEISLHRLLTEEEVLYVDALVIGIRELSGARVEKLQGKARVLEIDQRSLNLEQGEILGAESDMAVVIDGLFQLQEQAMKFPTHDRGPRWL